MDVDQGSGRSTGAQRESVRLEIEKSLVRDSPEASCCSLKRTLFLLLSTGSTQDGRKTSLVRPAMDVDQDSDRSTVAQG